MKIARVVKNGQNQIIKEQTIKEHLLNVSFYCKEMANRINLEKTAYLIGILHDMGKLNTEFQEYIKSQSKEEVEEKINSKIDHAVFGAKYIYETCTNNQIEQITSQIISLVICYHHGGLPDSVEGTNEIPLLKRIKKVSNNLSKKIFLEFEEMFKEINFINLFKESSQEIKKFLKNISSNNKNAESIYFAIHLLIKTLYSILIDSDWLDSYLFASESIYESPKTLKDDIDFYLNNLKNKYDDFKAIKVISKLQQTVFDTRNKIYEDCVDFAKHETGIYTLTVPTGGGKTISSLNFALNHAKIHNKDRIFYIEPYTSIIEQNAEVIRNALLCVDNLLEYHSNVIQEDNEDSKLLSSRWDYQFIFTTIVQFLNTIYASPSQDIRRFQSLINSIIIFDEVQSLPIHCISLFNSAINYLSKCLNCTIVLCTATQPILDKVQKPIYLSSNSEIIKDVKGSFDKLKRVDVVDKTKPSGYTYEEGIDFLLDLKQNNKNVLMIVNTVKTAEELFYLLKNFQHNSKIFYLCSNLCPIHRKKVIQNLKKSIENGESVICISTQVIECGVDISFSTVIRSIAGLDSIAQASGRCNRHGEKNIAETYIINFNDDLENTSKILGIDIGKKKTKNMLDFYKNDSNAYDNSLLSTKAISKYFLQFVKESKIEKELDYYLPKEDTTIYKLLSINNKHSVYKDNTGKNYPLFFSFQFKTARGNFKVIEDNTKSVVVPYGRGKEIIASLTSSLDLADKVSLLKKAQHYLVNIYENKFNDLKIRGGIVPCEIEGVYLLKDGFYNKDIGIILDKYMTLEIL